MLVLAHRGSPGPDHVENTVPAIAACLAAGADGVEVDLRLTVDGVLAVSHDADLRRVAGCDLTLARTPWADLTSACAAASVPLARVEEVLTTAAGRPVVLELKHPLPGQTGPTAVRLLAVLEGLRSAGLPLDVTVSSFAPRLVSAVRATAPARLGLRTALLGLPTDRPTSLLRRALDEGHDQVHPNVAALLAEPDAVDRCHALGVAVVPWTVNRGRALRRLVSWRVDGVITDVPMSTRRALAPLRGAQPKRPVM